MKKIFLFVSFLLLANGCIATRSIRVGDNWEPLYQPNFQYNPKKENISSNEMTIGIIKLQIEQIGIATGLNGETLVSYNPQAWSLNALPEEIKIFEKFKANFSKTMENIMMAKGIRVAGPFSSYTEMTFPDKKRCAFLILPKLTVNLTTKDISDFIRMPECGGPNLEAYAYAIKKAEVSGNATLEYIIFDPITYEKLERHEIFIPSIKIQYDDYYQGFYNKNDHPWDPPRNWTRLDLCAKLRPKMSYYYSQFYNPINVSSKILENIFYTVMPKLDAMITIDEFEHLKKYQEELREKKRF